MNKQLGIPLLCAGLIAAWPAHAQSGGWQKVENLSQGDSITVLVRHRVHCRFEDATDEALACMSPTRTLAGPIHFSFPRAEIRQVRLEHSDAINMMTGAALGGAVGAAAGASKKSGSLTREGSLLLAGGIGALVGGSFGKVFPMTHGLILYEP